MGSGSTPDTADENNWTDSDAGVPWVAIGDMSERDFVESTSKLVSQAGIESKRLTVWPAGTLLFSMYASLGHVSELRVPSTTNQAILALVPSAAIEQSFLMRWFQFLRPHLSESASSNTQDNLNAEKVRNLMAVVPPTDEQVAVAAFLDRETAKIDALVAEQRRLMDLLKEKRQAVISHAVTQGLNPDAPMKPSGIDWLGDVPVHWEVGPLKRYWSVTDCKHVTAEFVDDGIPVASIREVQSRWVALEDAKCTTEQFYDILIEGGRKPLPGDLIFSRNATVGEVAQVHVEHPRFAMGQDVVLLRKFSLSDSSDYLQHVIRSPIIILQLANMMIGSTFKRINVEEIRSFLIPSPPASEQAEIANFLEAQVAQFDTLTTEAQRAIDLLQERRTALISAAVTGQIDVRNVYEC
jgi:type I restriction enzyme S subunit